MNETTKRARAAHGVAVAVAWTALAAALTLVPAGAADAMPILRGNVPNMSAQLTTAQHVRPMPRIRINPNPRLWSTPNIRLR